MTDSMRADKTAATRKHWSGWGARQSKVELRIKNFLSAVVLATATFLLVAKYMA